MQQRPAREREPGDAAAATLALERALLREAVAAGLEREEGAGYMERLQATSQRGKRKGMHMAQRLRVSVGRAEADPLTAAANAAGYTLRSLAEKLRAEGYRVSHPFLRQCREGTSAIRQPLAARIEALTGFRATKQHWPKGWAKEPRE